MTRIRHHLIVPKHSAGYIVQFNASVSIPNFSPPRATFHERQSRRSEPKVHVFIIPGWLGGSDSISASQPLYFLFVLTPSGAGCAAIVTVVVPVSKWRTATPPPPALSPAIVTSPSSRSHARVTPTVANHDCHLCRSRASATLMNVIYSTKIRAMSMVSAESVGAGV